MEDNANHWRRRERNSYLGREGLSRLYIAKFIEAIYVLHAFEKKTQKTSKLDLELAQTRYRELINERG